MSDEKVQEEARRGSILAEGLASDEDAAVLGAISDRHSRLDAVF